MSSASVCTTSTSLSAAKATTDEGLSCSRRAPDPHDPFARIIGQRRVIPFLKEIRDGVSLGAHPHPLLFLGRSGHGKTSLSKAFAESIGAEFVRLDCGPELKSEHLVDRLTAIKSLAVVFCDEMQSMKKRVQEVLYSAIDSNLVPKVERGRLDRCAAQVKIVPFILAGATNEPGRLLSALRSRMVQVVMDDYTVADLEAITRQKARRFLIDLSDRAVDLVVRASGRSPRNIVQILQAVEVTSAAWRLGVDLGRTKTSGNVAQRKTVVDGPATSLEDFDEGPYAADDYFADAVGDLLTVANEETPQADVACGQSSPAMLSEQPAAPAEPTVPATSRPRIPDEFVERALDWMGIDIAGLDATGRTLLGTIARHGRATAELLSTVLGLDVAFTRENLAELRARHLVSAAPGRGWVLTNDGTTLVLDLGLNK